MFRARRDAPSAAAFTEAALQRLVTVYIVTGLVFLLLPGTFLGVWNLISISSRHTLGQLPPAWIQAHGHAQLFGWLGTFIIGIGFYSLSKMGATRPVAVRAGWTAWVLWSGGAALRWAANVSGWEWRTLLPLSAGLQLAGFLIFFATVSRHKRSGQAAVRVEPWMKLVIAATVSFLLALLANVGLAVHASLLGEGPAIGHELDQRFLFLSAWGFPVLAVWGFNARWAPVFLGLKEPRSGGLMSALVLECGGLAAALLGQFVWAAVLLLAAAPVAAAALRMGERAWKPAKTQGVSATFPYFVRGAYLWLGVAAVLGVWAALADAHGGLWGASRHALTVGFLATMVFAIGQRVLPAFCGMRVLYSKGLMLASLAVLNTGCLLRVAAEIPAYEWDTLAAWKLLPVSAVTELTAVTLFAVNLLVTLWLPPPRPAVTVGWRPQASGAPAA